MMKILVTSHKGGSGKTTLVAHLAVKAEQLPEKQILQAATKSRR